MSGNRGASAAVAASALGLILALSGCAAPQRAFVSTELRAASAAADTHVYPLLIVTDRTVFDPHEAARFGENLRRLGMVSLRLSPHRIDVNLTRRASLREMTDRTLAALRARVRSDPPGGRFALVALYAIDEKNRFASLHAVGVNSDGAEALRVVLDGSSPQFRERPPTLMYEAADMLATAVADELGLPRP